MKRLLITLAIMLIAVMAMAQTYALGKFVKGTTNIGDITLVTKSLYTGYVTYIAEGNIQWAKMVSASGVSEIFDIATDADGNCYITGVFQGVANPAPLNPVTGYGYTDIFLPKLNSKGEYVWFSKAGGTNSDYGKGICLDEFGNVYIAGSVFSKTAKFGEFSVAQVYPANTVDAFVAKLDPDGNWLWVKATSSKKQEVGHDLVYENGVLTLLGQFMGEAKFDNIKLTASGWFRDFAAAITTDGMWLAAEVK